MTEIRPGAPGGFYPGVKNRLKMAKNRPKRRTQPPRDVAIV